MKKAILLIIDGLGDLPTPKTPLQAAKKPHFDKLAKEGITGLLSPISPFVVPGSDVAHLNLLGYDPLVYYDGRGPLEALGLGMDLKPGDVAFRANYATIDGETVTDRRAGRIDTQTASALSKYVPMKIDDVEVLFKNSAEHRGALILRGPGLSSKITPTDPHDPSGHFEGAHATSKEGAKTARIINEFTSAVRIRLSQAVENQGRQKPANIVLLRGAGSFNTAPSFSTRFGISGVCIAGGALYKGVSKFIGLDIIDVPGATGDKNTDLKAKARATISALSNYDFVFLHVKGCDSAGHDGKFDEKKKMLERIDKELLPSLIKSGAYLIITGDHSTPCSRKAHSGHEVPLLVWGDSERIDGVKKFDEISCMAGGLGHLQGKDVLPLILNLIEKSKKYGS
ncbi:2,3-bisphosphoglycerate-independent phosphoglycerate mutase [Candidatus Micrarchaeota archaeon]|nr:2,3-bisphosphoglycerate-independent phosphoglycerate mutase [Candidatus Micrarchaeota archaeon]